VWGLYSFDGRDLLVELEELHEYVAGVENKRAAKAMQLSRSVMEISDALVDLGVFPIRDIPAAVRPTHRALGVPTGPSSRHVGGKLVSTVEPSLSWMVSHQASID
jgi:hypothetical protein